MKTKFALAVAALAVPALACGPWFPSTIIDQPHAILAAPFARFADSLAKIPPPAGGFRAMLPAPRQTVEEHTLAAELADLAAAGVPGAAIERHRLRRVELAKFAAHSTELPRLTDLARTDGLPLEFAHYYVATLALASGQNHLAIEHLQALLALPPAARHYKSTWAAFMLGRQNQDNDPAAARAFFQQVRQLARDGFADSTGLAASSLGWEAKTYFDHDDLPRAAALYLEQFATGDDTAATSLRFLATELLAHGTARELDVFAADSRLREIPTAALVSWRENHFDGTLESGSTGRWLAALERAGVADAPHAARLALATYRAADFTACERWLRLASADDDVALWLRAKLALREGRLAESSALLSRLVRHSASADSPLAPLLVSEDSEYNPIAASAHLRAELATLKLASRDYAEALALLLDSEHWEDAAYVAERVLTVDELLAFVAAGAHAPPARAQEPCCRPPISEQALRHLLARRLVRQNRLAEAREFFPASLILIFDQFAALLAAGRAPGTTATVRAASLMEAARLLRAHGLLLRGTELEPDYLIWGGSYEGTAMLKGREALPASFAVTADERARAAANDPGATKRFHYRYLAADLAWEAIALMPDESEATARALVEAGGWIKFRDPRGANRFYQALVRRCGTTDLGQAAAAKHWFPAVRL